MKRLPRALLVIGAIALAIGLAATAFVIHRRSHGLRLDAVVGLAALGVIVIAAGLLIWRHERHAAARRREEAGEALAELFAWPQVQRRQIVIRDHGRARRRTLVLSPPVPLAAERPVSPWATPDPHDTIDELDDRQPIRSEGCFSSDVITDLMRRPTEG